MSKNLKEIGSPEMPETIWTIPVEKVRNQNGKYEYIISIPDKVRKYMKLKEGDNLFWGERFGNVFEVRKAKNEELHHFKINRTQDESIREGKSKLRNMDF